MAGTDGSGVFRADFAGVGGGGATGTFRSASPDRSSQAGGDPGRWDVLRYSHAGAEHGL